MYSIFNVFPSIQNTESDLVNFHILHLMQYGALLFSELKTENQQLLS